MPKKRKLPATEEELQFRGIHLGEQLHKESERGIVLLAATLLDENLELLLRHHFASKSKKIIDPLFDGFGPLATFSGKIKISFAFSIITDDEFHDLEILRDIRNHFAHQYEKASFDEQWIVARTRNLRLPKTATKLLRDVCFHTAARFKYHEEDESETLEAPCHWLTS
jgi:DNA-binding MltR family transcriptional regulator